MFSNYDIKQGRSKVFYFHFIYFARGEREGRARSVSFMWPGMKFLKQKLYCLEEQLINEKKTVFKSNNGLIQTCWNPVNSNLNMVYSFLISLDLMMFIDAFIPISNSSLRECISLKLGLTGSLQLFGITKQNKASFSFNSVTKVLYLQSVHKYLVKPCVILKLRILRGSLVRELSTFRVAIMTWSIWAINTMNNFEGDIWLFRTEDGDKIIKLYKDKLTYRGTIL